MTTTINTDNVKSINNDRDSINTDAVQWDWAEMVKQGSGETIQDAAHRRANIGTAADGTVQMFGTFDEEEGTHAWHDIGTAIWDAVSSEEALALIRADFEVGVKDLRVMDDDGNHWPTGGKAIYRKDTGALLTDWRAVSNDYTPVSPREMLAFADQLVMDGIAKYETGAVLGKGEKVFFLMRMPCEFELRKDDKLIPYMLVTAANDGTGGIQFIPTFQRPVCQNTLRVAKDCDDGELSMSFRHSRNVHSNIEQAVKAFCRAAAAHEHYAVQCVEMVSHELDDIDTHRVFNVAIDAMTEADVAGVKVSSDTIAEDKIRPAIAQIESEAARDKEQARFDRIVARRNELRDKMVAELESDHCPGRTAFDAVQAVNGAMIHGVGEVVRYVGSEDKRALTHRQSMIDGKINKVTQMVFAAALELSV
jgi:phage/plasmid-like protein (TIGR03299 family)